MDELSRVNFEGMFEPSSESGSRGRLNYGVEFLGSSKQAFRR